MLYTTDEATTVIIVMACILGILFALSIIWFKCIRNKSATNEKDEKYMQNSVNNAHNHDNQTHNNNTHNNNNNNSNNNNNNNDYTNNSTQTNNSNSNNNNNNNPNNEENQSSKQRTDTLDMPKNVQNMGMERAASTTATPRSGGNDLSLKMPLPSDAEAKTNGNGSNNGNESDGNTLGTPRITSEMMIEINDKTKNEINADIQATPGHTPRVVMSQSGFIDDDAVNVLNNLSGSEEDLLYGNFDPSKFDAKKIERLKSAHSNTPDPHDNIDLI